MQAITWKLLLRDCPEIAALVTDCESIIRHERWPWYSRWLGDSREFRRAVDAAAWQLGCDAGDVRRVALPGLLNHYRTTKERLGRNPRGVRAG